ncbi:TPA: DNA-binding protein [Pseudomonas aeruginosa]
MTMEDTLLQRFGPLMSLAQLAGLLDRSPDGLRISLRATNNEWTQRVNKARLKIGLRIYFRTSQIAEVLSDESLYHTGN